MRASTPSSVTRVSERFRCKTEGCPWPKDEEVHVPWCLDIQGVEHWTDKPTHQHWPKKGMGAGRKESRIVAILCEPCHDRVDNTPNWDNAVSPGLDGQDEYTLWDTQVEGGWNSPLISRVLEAGSAAAEVGGDSQHLAGGRQGAVTKPLALPRIYDGRGEGLLAHSPDSTLKEPTPTGSAAAPPASAKSSAGEAEYPATDSQSQTLSPSRGLAQRQSVSPAEPFSLNSWCSEGMQLVYWSIALRDAKDEVRFRIGDWFNRGEGALSEQAYGFLRGFKDVTVRQYSWVAACVPPDTRVSELDWTHHRVVAALPAPEQGEWLKKAKEENLTSKALYHVIHGEKLKIRRYSIEEIREQATIWHSTAVEVFNVFHFIDWLEAK